MAVVSCHAHLWALEKESLKVQCSGTAAFGHAFVPSDDPRQSANPHRIRQLVGAEAAPLKDDRTAIIGLYGRPREPSVNRGNVVLPLHF
jgi:hypothetical protein